MKRPSVMVLLFILLSPANVFVGQDKSIADRQLTPGVAIKREIVGGQSHPYGVALQQGQFLRAVVDSEGIDVVATLIGPGGEKLLTVDLLKYPAPEPVSFIAPKPGLYRLQVSAAGAPVVRGRYTLTSEVKASATEADKDRQAAEQLLLEANLLESEGSKESLQKSIDKRAAALLLLRKLGDKYWEAYALHYSGRASGSLDKKPEALAFYNQALSLRKEIGDRFGESASLNNSGIIYAGLGDREKALDHYNQAVTISKAIGDLVGEARTLGNLGSLYDGPGDKQKAIDYFNQALLVLRAVGDKGGEAGRLNDLGNLYYALGDKQRALEFYTQALPLNRAANDKGSEAATLYNLAIAYSALGDKQKALEFYNQALAVYRAVGDKNGEADTLSALGGVYYSTAEKQALEFYNQALLLKRAVGNQSGEATALYNLGTTYSALGEKQKALEYCNQALALKRVLGDKSGEADTLNLLGSVYTALRENQKALECYNQALSLKRAVGDKSGECVALNNLGLYYYARGERRKALELYNQALPLARSVADKVREANTLVNLGYVHSMLGDKQQALQFYNQALPLKRALGDKSGEATVLSDSGLVYGDLGDNQKALELYNQALPLARAVGDKGREAATLNYIGTLYGNLGEKRKALDYYNQALVIRRALQDDAGQAATLHDLGNTYTDLSEWQKALDYLNQALPIFRKLGNQADEALTLNSIGSVYYRLGEPQKALELYQQALPIYRAIDERKGGAMTFGNMANVYRDLGQRQKALEFYQHALLIFRDQGDRLHQATAFNNIGITYHQLGEQQHSIDSFTQALELYRAIGDREGEAYALVNIANSYDSLGDKQKALDLYEQALLMLRAVADQDAESTTLALLMWLSDEGGKSTLAVFYGKQSVNLLQHLRANMTGLDKSLQRSFLHSKENTYRRLANILIAHGRLSEAEEVLALLKNEEYSSLRSRGDPKSEVGYSSAEAEAVKVLDQVGELGREQDQLRNQKEKKLLDQPGQLRLDKIDLELMPKANAEFRRALAAIEKEAPDNVVKTAEVREAQSLMRYLRELGPGTVALYTVVSTEAGKSSKGWVILVTPNFQKAYEMDVADLDQTVAAFRQTLRSPQYDPQPLAQKLYQMIFLTKQKQGQTLAADLDAYLRDQKEKTLMWSLDGVLRYVPMAALHDGKGYLVERYRNVVFTPASLPGLMHERSREWNALGLGVARKYEGFTALSGVPQELSAIVRDGQKHTSGVLPGTIKWDDEFKEKAMMDSLREGYNVVHIASHFSYQPTNPEKSFLLLGDGGHLEMSKIQDLTTLFEKTDLVTLSACDTAVGSAMKDANGKDVEGFAYVTQKLGALAVIASLWPVDDVGTQVLMPSFYSLRQSGLSKAEALRQAQLSLLKGSQQSDGGTTTQRSTEKLAVGSAPPAVPFKVDPNAKYGHPYYWAPFVLIGNWK